MKPCNTCPFAYSEESETVQNYGCLRTAVDIINLKMETGNNWACHTNNNRICKGLILANKENDLKLDMNTGKLHLQPCENSDFISWKKEDLKPILK